MAWYYWIIIFGFMAVMLILLNRKQKKQEKMMQEAIDALQVGDRVVTHIGIFGRIKKIYETSYGKVCVLEIGTNQKMDIEMDIRYIAGKDEKTLIAPEETNKNTETVVTNEVKEVEETKEQTKEKEETKKSKKNKK